MARNPRLAALDYLRYVLETTGMSPSALAKEAKLASTTLTRPLNDTQHQFALTTTTLEKIRSATNLDFAPFLQADLDTVARSIDMLEKPEAYDRDETAGDRPTEAIVVMGEVAAGTWREVRYLDQDFLWMVFLAPTQEELKGNVIGLLVKGESLNRIARENDVLVVESIQKTGRQARDGDLVVVERRRDQEGLIEVTAKRLRNQGRELWPESDDPRFQEPLRLGETTDEIVQIIGIVHYIVRSP